MSQFRVTLHKGVNGIIPYLGDRQEVVLTASDEKAAAELALKQSAQGWVVTHVELLGGSESENVKEAGQQNWNELYDAQVKRAKLAEARLVEQIRVNEKTAANVKRARAKRRDADERALALGRYTAELQDQIRLLKEQNEIFDKRDKDQIEVIQKLRSENRDLEESCERLLNDVATARELLNAHKIENAELEKRLEAHARETNKIFEGQHAKIEELQERFDGETAKSAGWSAAQNLAEKTAGCVDSSAYEFVNAPKHYNDHPSGVECQIIIRECKDPLVAFAMKHLWRSQWGGKPGQTIDQDFAKAIEYIQLEQARRAGKDRL